MNDKMLRNLLQQYFDGSINGKDCMHLLNCIKENSNEFDTIIDEELLNLHDGSELTSLQKKQILDNIKNDKRFKIPVKQRPQILSVIRTFAKLAALIFLFSAISIYFISIHKPVIQNNIELSRSLQILPGTHKAVLTLGNGKSILLDSNANSAIVQAGKVTIQKAADGKLVYVNRLTDNKSKPVNNTLIYNTLSTPRGGAYQVVLPDGTNVWLNSASSLSYPVEFAANERRVKLTGEAYFEVAKNKHKPFYVTSNNVEVKVLGTHFNISAYSDDHEMATTLLEGSVEVSKDKERHILSPGYQIIVDKIQDRIKVEKADVNGVIAWKNDYFIFNDDNIAVIMKKISRWYNVDVELKGTFINQNFGGTFSRAKSIDELLKNLEKIGKVHFKIEGRRITVWNSSTSH